MLKLNEDGVIPISPARASASTIKDALSGCLLRGLLDKMYETGQRFGWNILGTSIHYAIERTAIDDLDFDQAADVAHTMIWDTIQRWDEAGYSVRYSNGRGMDTLEDDVDDCLATWFKQVHPDSADRMFRYMAYKWPFEPEVQLSRPGFHTIIDAVFHTKDDSGVALVDWKSGVSKKADPVQMWVYEWAWGEFKKSPVVGTWFAHLTHGEVQDADGDYPGDDYVQQMVDYAEIMVSNMTLRMQPKPFWVCGKANLCPHRDLGTCPAYGGDLQQIKSDAKLLVTTDSL